MKHLLDVRDLNHLFSFLVLNFQFNIEITNIISMSI